MTSHNKVNAAVSFLLIALAIVSFMVTWTTLPAYNQVASDTTLLAAMSFCFAAIGGVVWIACTIAEWSN